MAQEFRRQGLEDCRMYQLRLREHRERESVAASRRWHAFEFRRQARAGEFSANIIRLAKERLAAGGHGAILEGSAEFSTVCHALLLAIADVYEADAAWIAGDDTYHPRGGIMMPDRHFAPTAGVPSPAAQPPAPTSGSSEETLKHAFESWLREKPDMSPKTVHECRLVIRRLAEVVGGDPPLRSITHVHVRTLQQALVQMPRSMPRKDQLLPILKIVAKYKDVKIQRIAIETVIKQIGLLQSFFNWARDMRYISENIAAGMKPKRSKRGRRRRIGFGAEDLTKIFTSQIYTGCVSAKERFVPGSMVIRDEYFWLPLLALFTGGRLEELGSLLVSEVKSEAGILYLDLDVIEQDEAASEDDDETTVQTDSAMKSYNSLRAVPIHPVLLQCGFAEYVSSLRARGETRLFPNLKPDRFGKLTSAFSKWFRRLLNHLEIADRRKVFHSFRHEFKSACRRAQLIEEHHDSLTGHANRSVGRQYGEGVPMAILAEAMAKISYPGLDLSHLIVPTQVAA